MSLDPHLYFDGQCEETFKFYEKRLGGKITFMMAWEGASMAGQAPPGWAKKILHAGLALGTACWRAVAPRRGNTRNRKASP
jgi:PhnB protein